MLQYVYTQTIIRCKESYLTICSGVVHTVSVTPALSEAAMMLTWLTVKISWTPLI